MIRCSFDGTDATAGIELELGSSLVIEQSTFDKGVVGIDLFGSVTLEGTQNVISGTSLAGLLVHFPISVEFQSNDIVRTEGDALRFRADDSPPISIDVRNNYWGVETAAEVEDLILHAPDGEPGVTGTALYEPFALRTVPTRTMSFSELRALFGAGH